MAISTSFSNFFSFLSPQTKPQLPLLSQFPSHHHNHRNNKIIPLVLSRNETASPSITSSPPPPPPPKDVSSDFSDFNSSSLYTTNRFNVEVVLEDGEPEDRLLNRFRKDVLSAGILQEYRRRQYHENKQDEKKRKIREASVRNRRSRFPRRPMDGNSPGGGRYNNYWQDDPTPPEEEEDEDIWDLPEEDVLRF
ncbi:unnamed protein product [Lathyrus sativus]|nr:unnamed protein product [Lathyrus sativus]